MREQLMKIPHTTKERETFICGVLESLGVEYEIQEYKDYEVRNIVVKLNPPGDLKKVVVLGAHYDVFPRSTGLNDNGASVIMLLEFIKNYRPFVESPVEIVFFDREETGMVGSRLYVRDHGYRVHTALIFDIIAFGDKLVFGTRNENVTSWLTEKTTFHKINFVLPSDNLNFIRADIPVALITAAPECDLEQNEDGSFHLIGGHFYSSFHNGKNDNNIDVLNTNLITEAATSLSSLF